MSKSLTIAYNNLHHSDIADGAYILMWSDCGVCARRDANNMGGMDEMELDELRSEVGLCGYSMSYDDTGIYVRGDVS